MTRIFAAALALGFLASCKSSSTTVATPTPATAGGPAGAPSATDPRTWPRMDAVAFGCLLEKAGAAPEPAYKCGAAAPPTGDPCKNTEPYYAGPAVPDAVAAKIADVEAVHVEWEHASLRHVTMVFKPDVAKEKIAAAFPLQPLPENVMGAEIVSCSKTNLCLSLTGFEHMGAGDVDCSTPPAK